MIKHVFIALGLLFSMSVFGQGNFFWSHGGMIESCGSFTDSRDGHVYKCVKIGTQRWMAENLAYLPTVSPSTTVSRSFGYYYVYGYEGTDVSTAKSTDNYNNYGVLYNWPAAYNSCPNGWHLPSNTEWQSLASYLTAKGFGYEDSGDDIAKAIAYTSGWSNSNTAGHPGNSQGTNNSSKLGLKPGGKLLYDGLSEGFFIWLSEGSFHATSNSSGSTNRYYMFIQYSFSGYGINENLDKADATSVRCIHD